MPKETDVSSSPSTNVSTDDTSRQESVASSFHESAAPLEAALAEVAADGILEVLEVVNEAVG